MRPVDKKTNEIPVQKKYYTVKLEATIPVTLEYRILAESAEQALSQIEKAPLASPYSMKPIMNKLRKAKIAVYDYGTMIVRAFKNF